MSAHSSAAVSAPPAAPAASAAVVDISAGKSGANGRGRAGTVVEPSSRAPPGAIAVGSGRSPKEGCGTGRPACRRSVDWTTEGELPEEWRLRPSRASRRRLTHGLTERRFARHSRPLGRCRPVRIGSLLRSRRRTRFGGFGDARDDRVDGADDRVGVAQDVGHELVSRSPFDDLLERRDHVPEGLRRLGNRSAASVFRASETT